MAKRIAYPKLPKAPRRVTPGVGQIALIKEPAIRNTLRFLQDRQVKLDAQLKNLDTFALKAGSPISAFGQRILNVGEPVGMDDAVPLWFLRQFVNTQASLVAGAGSGDGGGGELSNANGPIGAGSAPPTVMLANLYSDVAAYASANPADFANSCISGGGSWAFMTGLVVYLQAIDSRVGGNGKRGNTGDPSTDALAYYHGVLPPISGSKDVFVVDVIAKSCSPEMEPSWQDVTTSRAAGAWLPSVP